VPVGGHCRPIGFAIFGGSTSILGDEPVKTLAEDCVQIHNPFLLVEELNAVGMRLRRVSTSAAFMLTTSVRVLRRIACVFLAVTQLLSLLHAVKSGTSLVGSVTPGIWTPLLDDMEEANGSK
jgi:hypothetical protein